MEIVENRTNYIMEKNFSENGSQSISDDLYKFESTEVKDKNSSEIESTHRLDESFTCSQCDFICASKELLSKHIISAHEINTCDYASAKSAPKINELLKCCECYYSCGSKTTLSTHIKFVHEKISRKHKLEVSDSEDESSDEYSYEKSDSSSESESEYVSSDEQMMDIRGWLEESSTPAQPRFSFTELRHIGDVPKEGNALDYFNLFFTDELIQRIVDDTNYQASRKQDTSFEDTNSNEIRIFLALSMLQDIVRKPNFYLYWSKKPLVDTPFFRQCMTQKRCSLIKKNLPFSNITDQQPLHKLNKILFISEYLRKKFSSLYSLQRDVTIDESLMLWKGRLGWPQMMPLKRSQFGIKLHILCDLNSGYVWDFVIYTGKGKCMNEGNKNLPVSTRIVMSLMMPLLGKGYCLITNDCYTSPQLAELLIEHQTDSYGIVKQTKKGLPNKLRNKKLKQKGELITFRRGKVLLMKWKYKKSVTLLSTIHSSDEFVGHGKFCHPDSRMPQIVKDCNYALGGFDCTDRSLSNYPTKKERGKKYFRKIFFHLVDLAVWNSFILYKNTGNKKSSLDFRMELINLLVAKYKAPDLKTIERPSTCNTPLRLSGRHFPSYVPETAKSTTPSRKCAVCSKKRDERGKRVRRESRYQCTPCNVGLCVVPCFGAYHTKPDLTH